MQLAKAFEKRGDINEEIKAWTDLVRRNPKDWKLHGELSQAYQRYANKVSHGDAQMNDESINVVEQEVMCWRRLVDDHPNEWELQLRLADAYARKTKIEDVLRALNYLKPKPRGYNAIGVLQAKVIKKREVDSWKLLVERHPESRSLQMQLEMAYNRKGNNEDAVAGWKDLVSKHPDQSELSIHLRRAYEKTNKNEEFQMEMEGWEELVRKNPTARTLQAHLAEVYSRNGDVRREVEGWTALLNDHPTDTELRDRLLFACLQCQSYDEAKGGIQGLDMSHPELDDLHSLLKQLFLGEDSSHFT